MSYGILVEEDKKFFIIGNLNENNVKRFINSQHDNQHYSLACISNLKFDEIHISYFDEIRKREIVYNLYSVMG